MKAFSSLLLSALAGTAFADPCITIQQQPANALTCPDGTAPFSVIASGSGPFSYQWQMETTPDTWVSISEHGAPLACGGNASHAIALPANSSITSIRAHGCEGPFNIRVIISSDCGSTTSSIAILTMCPSDFNCDNSPDFFDYLDFVSAFSTSHYTADFNRDDEIDFFDYLDFVQSFVDGC